MNNFVIFIIFIDEISLIDSQYTEDSYTGSWSDREFDWKDYLERNSEKPAPERHFKHVSYYLARCLSPTYVISMKIVYLNF